MLEKNFGRALKSAGFGFTLAAGPNYFDPLHPGQDVLHGVFDPTKPYNGTNASFQARYGFSPVTEKGPVTGGDGSSVQTIRDAMDKGFLAGSIDPNYDPFHDPEGEQQTRMDMLIVQGSRPGPSGHPLNIFNDLLLLVTPVHQPDPPHDPPQDPPPVPQPADPTKLLLHAGRFAVTVTFVDPRDGKTGQGQALALVADTTGAFWFFEKANLELMIKVIDGQSVNQHFWVYFGALSDVEYTVTVTDTKTGGKKDYHNPKGTQAACGDVNAFPAP